MTCRHQFISCFSSNNCCEFALKSHSNKLKCVEQKRSSNQYQSYLKRQQQYLELTNPQEGFQASYLSKRE